MKRIMPTLLSILLLTSLLVPDAVAQRRRLRQERVIKGTYPPDSTFQTGGFSFLRVASQGIELAPGEKYVKIVLKDDSGVPVYASIDRSKPPPGWDIPNDVVPPYENSDRITYFCNKTPGAVPIPPDGIRPFGFDILWLTIYEDPCPQNLSKIERYKTSLASGTFTVTLMDRPPRKRPPRK